MFFYLFFMVVSELFDKQQSFIYNILNIIYIMKNKFSDLFRFLMIID